MFDGRILELTEDVLLTWRLLIEVGRKRGRTFFHPGVLIAATAEHHDVTVVTRNVDEYDAAGVAVLNPWPGKTTAAREMRGVAAATNRPVRSLWDRMHSALSSNSTNLARYTLRFAK